MIITKGVRTHCSWSHYILTGREEWGGGGSNMTENFQKWKQKRQKKGKKKSKSLFLKDVKQNREWKKKERGKSDVKTHSNGGLVDRGRKRSITRGQLDTQTQGGTSIPGARRETRAEATCQRASRVERVVEWKKEQRRETGRRSWGRDRGFACVSSVAWQSGERLGLTPNAAR